MDFKAKKDIKCKMYVCLFVLSLSLGLEKADAGVFKQKQKSLYSKNFNIPVGFQLSNSEQWRQNRTKF